MPAAAPPPAKPPFGHMRVTHVGMNIDFHHPDGANLRLSPDVEDAYGAFKEKADIFVRSKDGVAVDAHWMLKTYLKMTGCSLGDYIPEKIMVEGKRYVIVVPLKFPEGLFHMDTVEGAVDVRGLKLALEVWLPQRPPEQQEGTVQ